MADMAEPLTCAEVLGALRSMIDAYPERANWPVHILDMEPDGRDEAPWDALVTKVEADRFQDDPGPVVSLLAWHSEDAK